MNCSGIKDKLLDFAENSLDDKESNEVRLHIENCPDCRKELEEILETLGYIKGNFAKISSPEGFMDNVRNRVPKTHSRGFLISKSLRTGVIAAALLVAFTVTGFATNGFNFLRWWQQVSIKESKSMEELIANGYGEHVNISARDKNIIITIENIVADDTGTILSYKIEDIDKKEKYMLNYKDGISIKGNFNYPFEGFDNPLKGDSILYSDEPHVQKGMFRLDPLKSENSTIDITISKLEYGDKKPLFTVEGCWKFSITVTKYESRTYTLDKEVDIDGNKVLFKEIKVAPTTTVLTYSYKDNQNDDCTISAFQHIKLISNGKQYKSKYMGTSSSKSDSRGNNEITLEFDSMYLDNLGEVKICIGSYIVNVCKSAYYDIDVNESFPQVFEYFGSKISIDNINVGNDKTQLTMSQSFEENQYERLQIEFTVKGHPFAGRPTYSGEFESYTLDKKGKSIQPGSTNEPIESIQPKTYITKQNIILQDDPGIEKLPPNYHDGKLIPEELIVAGYQETRYINESFTVKLNK